MSKWKEFRVGDHIGLLPGYPFEAELFSTDEGTPLIRIRDIAQSRTEVFYDGRFDNSFLIERGDVLIGMDGDFMIAKWKGPVALLNQRMLKLYQKNDAALDLNFVFYALGPYLLHINNITPATTVKHLSNSDVTNAMIRAPAIPDQRKIALILTTIDNAIEKTEALIKKYQSIKQGMMHDLFTRGVTKKGELRPPFEEAPHLYKQSVLGWIPKEWEVSRLETGNIEILDGDRGVNYPSEDELLNDGYCVFLNASNVTLKGFNWDTVHFISKEQHERLRAGTVLRGDIVITTRGTVGNIAYFRDELPFPAIRVNSGMLILRNHNPKLDAAFLYHLYTEFLFRVELQRSLSGSAQPQLPLKDLKTFRFLLPKPNEQGTIIDKVDTVNASIGGEVRYLSKLVHIKQGLMQDLLTGKVAVKVEEDGTSY